MVPTKLSALHRAERGDSLRSVAASFGLSSWQAVARAPGNEPVRDLQADSPLPAGTALRIPPKARDLLKQRMYLLAQAREFFRRSFDRQDRIFERDVDLRALSGARDAENMRSILGRLQAHAEAAIGDARLACGPIAVVNSGLALTHVHAEADVPPYGHGHPAPAGLDWVVEPALVHAWSQMWSFGLWNQRWRGCDPTTALERASVYKNVVRSKVVQRVELRVRETVRAIDRIDAERSAR